MFPTRSSGPSTSDQLIDVLSGQFRTLLKDNWIELWGLSNGKGDAKGAIAFVVKPNGEANHFSLASTFSFGCRMRHRVKQEHVCT